MNTFGTIKVFHYVTTLGYAGGDCRVIIKQVCTASIRNVGLDEARTIAAQLTNRDSARVIFIQDAIDL